MPPGGFPCEQTRWLSPDAISCLTPAGEGTNLPIQVVPCSCAEDGTTAVRMGTAGDGSEDGSAEQQEQVVFSYDEDALKDVLDREPALELRPAGLTMQMNRKQLVNTSGEAAFEVEFQDYTEGRTSYYAMMPAMVQGAGPPLPFSPPGRQGPHRDAAGARGPLMGPRQQLHPCRLLHSC